MPRLKHILYGVGLFLGLLFLYWVRGILPPFALGAVTAYLANPLVVRLEKRQVPRPAAILLVYLGFAVVVSLFLYAFIPSLMAELNQVLARLPRQTGKLEDITRGAVGDLKRLPLPVNIHEALNDMIQRSEQLVQQFARKLVDFIVGVFSRLFWIWLAPILAYYILLDWDGIGQWCTQAVPASYRPAFLMLIQEIDGVLIGFVLGRLMVSAIVGILMTFGFVALKIQFATLLGLIAGVFDLIPYLGPILGAIPAMIFAFLVSPWRALWVVVLFIVVNQLEAVILSPHIIGGRVGLHPVVTIFALLAGGHLFGVAGVLLAVPIAATLRVTITFIGRVLRVSESTG
ncbi:MAG: AI-2E family transporter [Firmicutes bacterium]|mgnify:CR=1 FL=1|nr:AI-2E family transporter [Bacillota bacterium]